MQVVQISNVKDVCSTGALKMFEDNVQKTLSLILLIVKSNFLLINEQCKRSQLHVQLLESDLYLFPGYRR